MDSRDKAVKRPDFLFDYICLQSSLMEVGICLSSPYNLLI
jgi:hypothetical protein